MQIVRRILMTHDVAGDNEGVVVTKSSHTWAKEYMKIPMIVHVYFLEVAGNFMLRNNKSKSTFSE